MSPGCATTGTSGSAVLWVDASSGASGDMLLAALHDVGVPAEVMTDAARAVAPVLVRFEQERRHGFTVARAHVEATEQDSPHRTWVDVRAMLDAADLDERVRAGAHATFAGLAHAEGEVHGVGADEVHFHEVGALDAIADIVGVCAGLVWLDAEVVVSPIALGGGTARSAHGVIPVPGPAVLRLLAGADAPSHGGPVDVELCTPTGAALLLTHATSYGPMPAMSVERVGHGGGTRVLADRLGALRLVRGHRAAAAPTGLQDAEPLGGVHRGAAVVLESNVDDLDPRVWPHVLTALLAAGAADAWLTPILMKKGRPAHTLHVLAPADLEAPLARVLFTHTSAIGLRTVPVTKTALERRVETVDVDGQPVRVKCALLDGQVVNAQPEHDDVVAAAAALGVPVKVALGRAVRAAADVLP